MADLVELAIVYDTAVSAQRVAQLDDLIVSLQENTNALALTTQRGTAIQEVAGGSMSKAGRAALVLSSSLQTGNISAASMAGNLGRVASVLLGPWGIAIGIAIGILTLFKNNQDKARDTAEKFAKQLRDVKRDVDDLFRPIGKTPFQTEVERITDSITDLDFAINKANTSWVHKVFGDFWHSGIQIGGPGGVSWYSGNPKESAEEIERNRERRQRARLLEPGAELDAARGRQSAERGLSHGLSALFDVTVVDRLSRVLDESKKNLEELVTLGLDPMSKEAQYAAKGIRDMVDDLRRAKRAEDLFRSGLQTMADSLEDFVVTGTLAFTDFLNNILRLLYRDFTGELIHGVTQGVFGAGSRGGGSGGLGGGTQTTGSLGGGGGINTSVMAAPVNFNISTMDAQGVAQFINTHGAAIAAEVTRQAGRSAGLRRAFRRG